VRAVEMSKLIDEANSTRAKEDEAPDEAGDADDSHKENTDGKEGA
jgi:ribosome-binding factor A